MGAISADLQSAFEKFMAERGEGVSAFGSPGPGLDRLVRKEDSLGAIREVPAPQEHTILRDFPFLDVATDDVIFTYLKDMMVDGLSPARAEDSEAELSQNDDLGASQGRASVIDWAEKSKYTASDVTRWRDANRLLQITQGSNVNLSLGDPGNQVAEFNARVARDDQRRQRRLYNRIEWLGQTALWTGGIQYNDGKIKFSVDYGRPAGQQDIVPAGPFWDAGVDHDPIGDLKALDEAHYNTYGVHLTRGITSTKVLDTIWKSSLWNQRFGIVVGGTPSAPLDMNYLTTGFTREACIAAVEAATGIRFEVNDNVYRTRPIGSSVVTNVRFTPEKKMLLLPDPGAMGEINDTELGFGRVLTAPHPEGNFTSGFYEWEQETVDPWMHVRGSGIKAFPVFPVMEYSVVFKPLSG